MNLPHQYCLLNENLRWLHVVFDLATAAAYFAIPASLAYLLRKVPTLPHRWMVGLFLIFITGCGLTHLMEVVTFWYPFYELEAVVMGITAISSIVTAALIGPLIAQIVMENAVKSPTCGVRRD